MIKLRQSGVWKEVQHIYIKSNGEWKEAANVFNKQNDVWTVSHKKSFFVKIVINSNATNFDLVTACTQAGWDGVKSLDVECSISPGVLVYATTTGVYAFSTVGMPSGSKLKLLNFGSIIGKGGAGGVPNSGAGQPGGPAIFISSNVTTIIENYGTIGGGGGGGGATGAYGVTTTSGKTSSCSNSSGSAGGKGEDTTAAGTRGGTLGVNGAGAGNTTICSGAVQGGGAGGIAGKCLVGSLTVSWTRTGNIFGGIVA